MIVIDLPKCEHVRAQLSELKTQRVYFEPLSGNNGDKLIEVATRHLFAELDLNLVRDPEQADSIVVIGGGWFHHLYPPHCETLTRLSQTYSDRPLYVLPISISIEAAQARAVFQGRTAPTYLYLRERPSYELACQAGLPESVRLFMDHDMAFCIQDSPYLRRLRQIAREQYILVVERIDPESVTGLQYQPFRSNWLVRNLPVEWKHPIRRWIWRRRALRNDNRTPFADEALRTIYDELPTMRDLPTYISDISSPHISRFEPFGEVVAQAAAIFTTRLHVAILGAVLGKRVFIKTGTYHKIQGVYDYSLAGLDSVTLVP